MSIVTVSSRDQVFIPRDLRDSAGIEPGQRIQVLLHEGRLELVPFRDISELRGFVAGIDTRVEREADRV